MPNYHRHTIRLPGYDYTQPGAYFITLVTHNRISLFGEMVGERMQPNTYGKIALDQWNRLPSRFPGLVLFERVLMPNHLHGIIQLLESRQDVEKADSKQIKPGSLGAIIRAYKSAVTQSIRWLQRGEIAVWQRNYYEHIIRSETEMQKICDYIRTNPLRWCEDRFFVA
jgi:REP element-mobilizing transposase RayT